MADELRHSLLTPAQETALAREVQAGLAAEARRRDGDTSAPVLRDIGCGREAVRTLVRHNMRLVADVANRKRTSHLQFEDHLHNGVFGLIRAAQKYDPDAGTRFSTYATWWIRQSIDRAIANEERTIRLPVHVYGWANMIRASRVRLFTDDAATIAAETGLTEEQVHLVVPHLNGIGSLDEPVVGSLALTTLIAGADAAGSSWTGTLSGDEALVEELLGGLDRRSRTVIELRFGFCDGGPRTLEQVGAEFGVTRERIRQIQSKALASLRAAVHARGLTALGGAASAPTGHRRTDSAGLGGATNDSRRQRLLDSVLAKGGRLHATEALAAAGVAGIRFLEKVSDADSSLPAGIPRLVFDGEYLSVASETPECNAE